MAQRLSRMIFKTSNESELLLKAGLIKKNQSGFYSYMPLGLKVLSKIETLLTKKLSLYSKVKLNTLLNAQKWKETGRFEMANIYKLKDSKLHDFILAPTHEEEAVEFVKDLNPTRKDYPLSIYQIGTKYRDEKRPRGLLLRTREFVMMDLYSFDINLEKAKITYNEMLKVYNEFFTSIELPFKSVQADMGDMGGLKSNEYQFIHDSGEDNLLICQKCDFGANLEVLSQNSCPTCSSKLEMKKSIEIGHCFLLGDLYTKKFNLELENVPIQMGCFGIGVSRLIQVLIMNSQDSKGIVWNKNIAPYKIWFVQTGDFGFKYDGFGDDILIDDRDLTYKKKISEAYLCGCPLIVVVGNDFKNSQMLEVHYRKTGETEKVHVDKIKLLVDQFYQ
jgi:prolyl-tRNA synthetase